MSINFFIEGLNFDLKEKRIVKNWIKFIVAEEERKVGIINFIFASDEYVIEINKTYLKHDYYTDIITFNYNVESVLNGDIFISIDTVRENALKYKVTFDKEIHRVIIHGVYHLLGFNDINKLLQAEMRMKEDHALDIMSSKFALK